MAVTVTGYSQPRKYKINDLAFMAGLLIGRVETGKKLEVRVKRLEGSCLSILFVV